MSRMKSVFAVLFLTVIVCLVPQAQAAVTVQVTIAGSSAMWQTLALGAFSLAGTGAGHWTSASNVVNLNDTRVVPTNVDPGTIWIVWNSTATKVWSFIKVDSVVGDRCYFAQPRCTVVALAANLGGTGAGQISSVLWGADSALPASIVSLFTNGTPSTVAATDIRPEDAQFAACRVNSALGAGSKGAASSDGLDGLGYNANNNPGICPAAGLAQVNYLGNPIKSGYPGSTTQANVLSFNIKGTDPITGTAIPAFTVKSVGAAPIVFVDERQNAAQLLNLTNATDVQLQKVFSGTDCTASALGVAGGTGINIFLREPLSGTMNTTEATVFRKPTVYPGAIKGVSQEANVNAPANNPLAGQAGTCLSAGTGARYRAIGTGEEVKSVHDSSAKFTTSQDGIGYTFFSYGNVSSIANNAIYGYIQLNGVDPIFAAYAGGDPGQPGNGTLPAAANLPAACAGAFPCPENKIWAGGLSFPNLRNGTYKSWSVLRLVSNGTGLTNATTLITHSQQFVVTSVPDYVPAKKTIAGGITDPGLTFQRSHYQQYDGAGTFIGAAPVNSGTGEAGGDMGGCIIKNGVKTTQSVNANFPTCVTRP
jgi:hypothetical protein